jgi:N4-(beta-N-acetylglucosaminyl)-L-asparaginase
MNPTRRDFLETSALLTALGFLPRGVRAEVWMAERVAALQAGAAAGSAKGKARVVSSANGFHTDRPSGVKIAYDKIVAGGDTLDSILAGVNTQELDPDDDSVGYGGLPNCEGVVQLDASCMHGPSKRAGAVACLEGIATPSLVAKAVMDYTDHILLVGQDAKRFALAMGFPERDLLTESSKKAWQQWKATRKLHPWIDEGAKERWLKWNAEHGNHAERPEPQPAGGVQETHGTINMNAVNGAGDVSSCTTTSGLSWKVPGRVGDSPIVGAGQYTDNTVGAAGSTGRGEANIKVCGGFLAVELMRNGMEPQAALVKVMERVLEHTEKRLLDDRGRPYFDLNFYALAKDGRYAGACAYEGAQFAVCDEKGPRLEKSAYLFKAAERPKRG